MAGTHSRLSASGAPAYALCLGKPNAEEGLSDETSVFAAEGTVFHEVAAWCLELGMEPEDFLGMEFEEDGYEFVWDEEFCRNLRPGLDMFRDLAAGNHMFVEVRVSLEYPLGEGEAGTCDILIVNVRDREITVGDWKYGQGVPVSPADPIYDEITGEITGYTINKQIGLYAIGGWNDIAKRYLGNTDDVKVRLIIEQPRSGSGGGVYLTTMQDLAALAEEMRAVAEATRDPAAPRTAGEKQCYFCKKKKTPEGCAEFTRFNFDLLSGAFDDIDEDSRLGAEPLMPDVLELTPERRAYIQRHSGLIESFLKENHRIVLDDALKGHPTPGLKAVYGRSPPRKWKASSEDKATEVLVKILGPEKAFKKELISPTQAEALVSETQYGTILSPLVDKGEPKPTLAPVSSTKPAIEPVADQFEDNDLI